MTLNSRVIADGLMFPEAPRWRDNRLWFTDQHAQCIMHMNTDGELTEIARLQDLPGGLGWLPDGRLVVVSMTRRRLLLVDAGKLRIYADLSTLASFHCNDLVIDHCGRAYVGNFGYDLHGGAPPSPAELVRVDTDGSMHLAATDLVFPNGMAITADGRTLFVAETFAARITRFDRTDDGSLQQPGCRIDLDGAQPDGICLDAAGNLWVAAPNRGRVLHVRPGGQVIDHVATTGTPYACMLGGPARRTLFITTSDTDDPQQARQLRSGRIEICEVETPGDGLP